jgi:hypothetical protein
LQACYRRCQACPHAFRATEIMTGGRAVHSRERTPGATKRPVLPRGRPGKSCGRARRVWKLANPYPTISLNRMPTRTRRNRSDASCKRHTTEVVRCLLRFPKEAALLGWRYITAREVALGRALHCVVVLVEVTPRPSSSPVECLAPVGANLR